MPELPEVEVYRRSIRKWLIGKSILAVNVRNKNLRWPISKKIFALKNEFINNVTRRAKYLLIELNNSWIIIHLGMSGSLQLLFQNRPFKKHDHIELFISDGYRMRYNDPRRFGYWIWSDNLKDNKMLIKLGIEPLDKNFNGNWIFDRSKNSKALIKTWLMNSKIIAGIGNIYSNEILFASKILPNRTTNSLSKEDSIFLANNIKKIILSAIQQGGTTICNFLQIFGQSGNFTKQLKVYGRNDKPCFFCQTLIQKTIQNGRSTFFCTKCQH